MIDQIAMTAMLQLLVFDIDKNGKLILSEMSRIIPDDFYGNRISIDGKHLFKPWQEQYQSYSSQANTMKNTAKGSCTRCNPCRSAAASRSERHPSPGRRHGPADQRWRQLRLRWGR